MSDWREVETQVDLPGRWLILAVGLLCLSLGAIGLVAMGSFVAPGLPVWLGRTCAAMFVLLGIGALKWAIVSIASPLRIRHAAPEVMPNVPREPAMREGSVVDAPFSHELIEDAEGWQLRPAPNRWRNDKRFILGFGIPFMAFFAGLLSWILHSEMNFAGWPLSIFCGMIATFASGGTAFLLMWIILRTNHLRLSRLSIPRNGGDLELDSPVEPKVVDADLAAALKWILIGDDNRRRLRIPRETVAAVQICPWKVVIGASGGRSVGWAVQGLLVLSSTEDATYHRLPILLTSDFIGAARLLQTLAETLHVPYLFNADAEGVKSEALRAKNRPPLRSGGM